MRPAKRDGASGGGTLRKGAPQLLHFEM